MIRLLIEKVVLYDDKVEIFYKYTSIKQPVGDGRQAFSFYSGEYNHSVKVYRFDENQVLAECFKTINMNVELLI